MTRAVFRPGEIEVIETKIVLDPPVDLPEHFHLAQDEDGLDEITEDVEEYSGPTVEDLRREAEAYKEQWEFEKEAMFASARADSERIIKEAEDAAFREVKRRTDEAQVLKREAQDEADKIIAEAEEKARLMEADAFAAFEADKKMAREEGYTAGREGGFAEGKAEVERLVQRTQIVLERAQDRRSEILQETEQEIINLVLLISRKVVKAISESQKNVVVSNVVQALRKLKGRGNILIRVNIADLKLTTEHINNFISLVEGAKSIQVLEDSSVDEGGCIIETDFGEIDARIASQLAEMEAKILEISPIKSRAKTAPDGSSSSAAPDASASMKPSAKSSTKPSIEN